MQSNARSPRTPCRRWVAQSAEEAQDILAQHAVDVVVSDHRLPGMHGTALLEHVRATQPSTRRILVTAYGDHPNAVPACESGVVERFFLKPFAPLALKGAVLELLRRPDAALAPSVLVADTDPRVVEQIQGILLERGIRCVPASRLADARGVGSTGQRARAPLARRSAGALRRSPSQHRGARGHSPQEPLQQDAPVRSDRCVGHDAG